MKPLRIDTMKEAGIGHWYPGVPDVAVVTDRGIIEKMQIKDGEVILDFGAGAGRDAIAIQRLFQNCIIVFENRLPIPFKDASVDVAFANGVLCEMSEEDAKLLISELKRVGKRSYYSEIYPDHSVETFCG